MDDALRLPSCSIGRAMEILGERWTLLILRECFYGVRRFSVMQRNLGIARNILSARLQLLVRTGISLAEEDRTRIATCADVATLDRWFDNALAAKTAADVFA